jgi:hypothetical protein
MSVVPGERNLRGRVRRLGASDRAHGRTHEAFAPVGHRFIDGTHTRICVSEAEALHVAQFDPVEPCPRSCECHDDEDDEA